MCWCCWCCWCCRCVGVVGVVAGVVAVVVVVVVVVGLFSLEAPWNHVGTPWQRHPLQRQRSRSRSLFRAAFLVFVERFARGPPKEGRSWSSRAKPGKNKSYSPGGMLNQSDIKSPDPPHHAHLWFCPLSPIVHPCGSAQLLQAREHGRQRRSPSHLA